ncbi:MAG: sn-glycerol-3-phosphate ABC transporter ATP-binding protein UgpC [Sedimentisphaerales bacterium]|nr:sn-glycerol-3-phosphate ABC transporter ATP-binding protein UgpC [Sedimentisphaerales bacterium]
MAEVRLRQVSKVYEGGVAAVRLLDLAVADGEFVVLVGPSGCGKTTTLRMIAGLEEVSEGEIEIGGVVVNEVEPCERDVAMVFQNYALYPHMTVFGNLSFGLRMRKVGKQEIEGRVEDVAKLLGLKGLLKRKPRQLSGGEQQRVALGRALVREPRVLLFDEPLSNLDAKMRVAMRSELKQLHQRVGRTTIYVTHDQEEAMSLGERIVVMNKGRVRQEGEPVEVYRRPVDRFVAGFLGVPGMNFLNGRIEEVSGRKVFRLGSVDLGLPERFNGMLEEYVGSEMVLGIRPEDLLPSGGGCDRMSIGCTGELPMVVKVVEPLGSIQDVYLEFGDSRIVCRCGVEAGLKAGECVTVKLELNRIHIFEPDEVGANVTSNSNLTGLES